MVSKALVIERELQKALGLEQLGAESAELAAFGELIEHPAVSLHTEHELGLAVQQTGELGRPRSRTPHYEAIPGRGDDDR
jgi:hypothetical protein